MRAHSQTEPEVSVIIPNYDRLESLKRATESVLVQEGVLWELIVVDDASSEAPDEVYRELEEAGHTVLRQSERAGPGPARNRGADHARGRYLAFLDSDDHWLPGKLSKQLASLKESGLRIGQVEEIWYRNGRRVEPLKIHRMEAGDLYERSLKAVCVSPSSVLLEKALFFELGGFDPELFVCEDYDLWLKIAVLEPFHLLAEPLVVKYGGHPDQLSKALPAMDRFRILALVKGFATGLFEERPGPATEELEQKIEILRSGALKRDRPEVLSALNSLTEAAARQHWDEALEAARRLVACWAATPPTRSRS